MIPSPSFVPLHFVSIKISIKLFDQCFTNNENEFVLRGDHVAKFCKIKLSNYRHNDFSFLFRKKSQASHRAHQRE